jgi:predicted amidohydrolase YtcJ
VTYPDWRQGVESAVLRKDKATGSVLGADQCISVEQAIQSYTINGAWQDHQEKIRGSIEPGKLADFTIIGEDILTIDLNRIHAIPILFTIVNGKIVYTNPTH